LPRSDHDYDLQLDPPVNRRIPIARVHIDQIRQILGLWPPMLIIRWQNGYQTISTIHPSNFVLHPSNFTLYSSIPGSSWRKPTRHGLQGTRHGGKRQIMSGLGPVHGTYRVGGIMIARQETQIKGRWPLANPIKQVGNITCHTAHGRW